jgi:tripartite ATP-independent transporter DctM subunit
MDPAVLGLLMFLAVCGVLMLGFPVSLTLAGTALGFGFLGEQLGIFRLGMLGVYPMRIFGSMTNEPLVAVPLFVFMGLVLEKSGIAVDLMESLGRLFGRVRGGLGYSVIFVGMLLAASTGIVGATVVMMGVLSLPTMMRVGYSPQLSAGIICASGTLGQIIPPSIVLVILADVLQGANEQAAQISGAMVPDPVTGVDLFAGALLPGLMLVGLYALWQFIVSVMRPEECPALVTEEVDDNLLKRVGVAVLPPLVLIVLVLGSILVGVATPTESAGVGAVGSMVLSLRRRQFGWAALIQVARETTKVSSMVFIILMGASMFSLVFRGFGGDDLVKEFLMNLPGGAFGAMLLVMVVMFVMGFFLDFIEIIFVVVPIVGPILIAMDLNPLWLGVMIGVNLQTSFLTPPFGFALFYLRGVAPPSLRTVDIYKGVIPFIIIQVIGLSLVWTFPITATWLPHVLFK